MTLAKFQLIKLGLDSTRLPKEDDVRPKEWDPGKLRSTFDALGLGDSKEYSLENINLVRTILLKLYPPFLNDWNRFSMKLDSAQFPGFNTKEYLDLWTFEKEWNVEVFTKDNEMDFISNYRPAAQFVTMDRIIKKADVYTYPSAPMHSVVVEIDFSQEVSSIGAELEKLKKQLVSAREKLLPKNVYESTQQKLALQLKKRNRLSFDHGQRINNTYFDVLFELTKEKTNTQIADHLKEKFSWKVEQGDTKVLHSINTILKFIDPSAVRGKKWFKSLVRKAPRKKKKSEHRVTKKG